MAIVLADHEHGPVFEGDYDAELAALQQRLARAQVATIAAGRRAIVVLEGWDAGGKGGAIRRLIAAWDPGHYRVHPIKAPSDEEKRRHFLWRFWTKLPADGEIAVFDRSWYGRMLVERVDGLIGPKDWRRASDEINEFEAQQKDSGTTIVKLFLHVTQAEQDARFRARLDHPWKRWKITADDFRARDQRGAYVTAAEEMFVLTDMRWAPWTVIAGDDKRHARLAVLRHVADALEKAVPPRPPVLDEAVTRLAREHFGMALPEPASA